MAPLSSLPYLSQIKSVTERVFVVTFLCGSVLWWIGIIWVVTQFDELMDGEDDMEDVDKLLDCLDSLGEWIGEEALGAL